MLDLEVQPYFSYIGHIWGLYCYAWVLWDYFRGWGQDQKLFGTYLHRLTNFILRGIALSCFFDTFPEEGGWVILMKTKLLIITSTDDL